MRAKKTIRLLLLALLAMFFGNMSAQHDWNWTFGDSILMRFPSGGTPVVDTSIKTRHFYEEGASYSNANGDLQIYANGDSSYNQLHKSIPNNFKYRGANLTNGLLILPADTAQNLYLVFYVSYSCNGPSYCLRHSLVKANSAADTNLTNDAVPYYHPFWVVTEKLSAVRSADGGWWVVYHGEKNYFLRVKVNGTKVSTYSSQLIGSQHNGPWTNAYFPIGEMTFSPEGDKLLAVSATGVVDVLDFDRCTGLLSNWDSLGTPAPTFPGQNVFYGCSFSPDGTKVYASEIYDNPWVSRLWQWDLNAPNVRASKTLIFTSTDSIELGQHQLGPDGKIYLSQLHEFDSLNPANYHLSVINSPNLPGTACDFQYASLYLQGRRTTYNLPNLPNYSLPPLVAMYADCGPSRRICPGDSVLLGVADTTSGVVDFLWSGAGITAPSLPQQWVSPDSSGWYFLTVTDSTVGIPCGVTVDSVWIEVVASGEIPAVSLGADTTICAGDSVTLTASAGPGTWEYAWSTGDTAGSVRVSVGGIYAVTVTYPGGTLHCHSSRDSLRLNVEQPLSHPAPRDTSFCPGECVEIGVEAVAGMTYQWSPTAGLANPTASRTRAQPGGTTNYTLTVADSSMVTANCRERVFPVLVREVGCNMQSFIAAGGSGLADVLDLGPHGGRMTLLVWDAAGRLVFLSEDYKNDWGATGLARGLYIYRATVEGDPMAIGCGAGSFTGKIIVIN